MLIASGTMLTPNLRLLRLLGRGGMGSVWLAEHLVLGSEVAVKLLSTELATNEEALERFHREATAVAQLKSPHVVGIHDFGTTAQGVPFFVMERLVGEDLSQRLDRVGQLPVGIVTAIITQIGKALARAHELDVVHRDLKPGNIFLTTVDGDLVVKLLDFGVAKMRGAVTSLHETSDQAMLGTPMYMSPEQILSPKTVGPASDLYSLAVVVYECLAGKRPFDGETAGAVHVGIVNGHYTKISEIDPSLSPALDAWFARGLAADPTKRFGSAREMAEAFLAASRSQFTLDRSPVDEPMLLAPSASHPAPTTLRLPRWPTPPVSTFGPVLAGVLVVLVLIGGILAATRFTKQASASSRASSPEPVQSPSPEPPVSAAPASVPPAPSVDPPSLPALVSHESPEASAVPDTRATSEEAPIANKAVEHAAPSALAPVHGKAPRRKNRGF